MNFIVNFLSSFRLLASIIVIGLVIFQHPDGSGLLNLLNQSKYFQTYKSARIFLQFWTWFFIIGFLFASFILAIV